MECEELLAALNDYVDGEGSSVDPAVCEAFREHMKGCDPCQIVVDNIRRTITLYRSGEPIELPIEFHDCLRRLLREQWQARFTSHTP